MKVYINGRQVINHEGLNQNYDSFALRLAEAISYCRDQRVTGEEVLITFSEDEEKNICNSSRKLLRNNTSRPNESEEFQEQVLFAKSIQAMISTIPVSSLETLRICNYIHSVGGVSSEGRRVGVIYHSFSSIHSEQSGFSFVITPIEYTIN